MKNRMEKDDKIPDPTKNTILMPAIEPGTGGLISELTSSDVLCGRGGRVNNHEGNIHFRRIVSEHKNAYLSDDTKKHDKTIIATKIVSKVRNLDPPGRFLMLDTDSGSWTEIGDEKARKKTGQALREDGPDFRSYLNEQKLKEKDKDKVQEDIFKLYMLHQPAFYNNLNHFNNQVGQNFLPQSNHWSPIVSLNQPYRSNSHLQVNAQAPQASTVDKRARSSQIFRSHNSTHLGQQTTQNNIAPQMKIDRNSKKQKKFHVLPYEGNQTQPYLQQWPSSPPASTGNGDQMQPNITFRDFSDASSRCQPKLQHHPLVFQRQSPTSSKHKMKPTQESSARAFLVPLQLHTSKPYPFADHHFSPTIDRNWDNLSPTSIHRNESDSTDSDFFLNFIESNCNLDNKPKSHSLIKVTESNESKRKRKRTLCDTHNIIILGGDIFENMESIAKNKNRKKETSSSENGDSLSSR